MRLVGWYVVTGLCGELGFEFDEGLWSVSTERILVAGKRLMKRGKISGGSDRSSGMERG